MIVAFSWVYFHELYAADWSLDKLCLYKLQLAIKYAKVINIMRQKQNVMWLAIFFIFNIWMARNRATVRSALKTSIE